MTLTIDGIPLASCRGMSFRLVILSNRCKTEPDRILAKKTFHIRKYRTLRHALFFLRLRATGPSIAEKTIIIGGTQKINNVNIALGRYPVTKSKIQFLQPNK